MKTEADNTLTIPAGVGFYWVSGRAGEGSFYH